MSDPIEAGRLLADLSLFASQVQEPALAVWLSEIKNTANEVALTLRELESLHWTMEGKTAWEVGRILSRCSVAVMTARGEMTNAS